MPASDSIPGVIHQWVWNLLGLILGSSGGSLGHALWRWRDKRWGADREGERADIFGPRFYVHLFVQVESSEAYVLIEQRCKPQVYGNV